MTTLLMKSRRLLAGSLLTLLAFQPVAAQELHSGIDPDGFDKNVRAQDDLFRHVNGRWLLRTEIPADKSNYGSFTALIDGAQAHIRTIIEEAAENPEGDNAKKVGDFYRSFMNEERIESLGYSPLKKRLKRIEDYENKKQIVRAFGALQKLGVDVPIGFFIDQDDKDSTRYLAAVIQSGTTLPDRDYYLKDDDRYATSRDALKKYIVSLFDQTGRTDGKAAADAILKLQTQLAKAQWARTELRNAEKRYNKFQRDALSEVTSRKFPWDGFFKAVGADQLTELNVMTPSFFTELEKIVDETPIEVWKQYLHFQVVDAAAPYLSKGFADAHFELHSKTLGGIPEQQPRWKRAVDTASGGRGNRFGVIGDAIGEIYVKRHFKQTAKQRMDELVANLLKTYEKSIHELTWMTDATKKQALVKLSKIRPKIGYPEKWRDYSALEIKPNDLIGNMLRSAAVEHNRMLAKLGKPVDRDEWGMTPQTVNAYYNPSQNEIVFPAAILQPPFFNAEAEDAVNYGGIGSVIGHEISHGFDDQGSKYDADGNLKNWWTDEDRAAFEKLAKALVEQYSSYEALKGQNVNGQLTLGENIADLSGMAIAYKAYMLSLDGKKGKVIEGYTPSQRFFLGWGQVWRRKYRDAELARRLVTDPHSPSLFRANGPVTNLDAFYEAFDVKPGDKLYKPKAERIQIW